MSAGQDPSHAILPELTPNAYAQLIADHANDPTGVGEAVNSLHLFLKIPYLGQQQHDSFVTICDLSPGPDNRHPRLRDVKTPQELQNEPSLQSNHNMRQLIFLKGYPSQEWVKTLGGKYQLDPAFFSRHLDFFDHDKHSSGRFTTPVLPSGSRRIIKLSCMTIATQDWVSQDVRDIRAMMDAGMIQHVKSLRNVHSHGVGDSIIRRCHVVDNKTIVLEQQITICLHVVKSGWLVVVWNDAGKNLHEDRIGSKMLPWRSAMQRHNQCTLHFAPIVPHRPMLALKPRSLLGRLRGYANNRPPQSVGLLDQDYGKSLRLDLMASDPAYALTEVFSLITTSHNQFLNVLSEKLSLYEQSDDYAAFAVLRFFKQTFSRHIMQLEEMITAFNNTKSHKWPKAADHGGRSHAESTMGTVHTDMEHLLKRAKQLHDQSHEAINLLMNSTSIADARDQASETERIGKLTFVAFFYAPLSFAASIFGMNFKEVGEDLPIWIWFAVAVPLLSFTFLAYVLPMEKLTMGSRRRASR